MRQLTDQNIEWGKWLGSAAVGALAMYLLDPERGAPRRAVSGLKLREMGKQTGDAAVAAPARKFSQGRKIRIFEESLL